MLILEHTLGEILEIHLVHDTDAGRHNLKRVERLHAPLHELVTLAVTREFELEVFRQRIGGAGEVHLHGVIDDKVNRHEWLNNFRVLTDAIDGRTHRGKIDEERHPGEILQYDASHHKRHLGRAVCLGLPAGERCHGIFRYPFAITIAQQRLEHQADRNRQAVDRVTGVFERGQRIEGVGRAVGFERAPSIERIGKTHIWILIVFLK